MPAKVHVSDHPLIATQLTRLRLHDLPPAEFRHGVKAIS
jgi:uracil phosphoribosyltransferase